MTPATDATPGLTLPVIDIHTHLAGLGQGGTDCFIAPHKFHSLLYKMMRWKLGIYNAHKQEGLDPAYLERLQRDVTAAAEHKSLHAAVIFAHDRIYTESGELHPTAQELYVPNEYAFRCAESLPGRFLPATSVHPYRKGALEEIEKWIERGAVALKWLPNSQCMDPRDARCFPIYDLLVRKNIPMIVHTGGEHTVTVLRKDLGDPDILRPALDRGVNVVMAHCGTKSGIFDTQWMPQFSELARKYPNCWGDTSAFCTPGRARWIAPMLRESGVLEKLVHGSDYPVPPDAFSSLIHLGWPKTMELIDVWSFLERDVKIKRARGFPDVVFTNTARVLGAKALQRWNVVSYA
jgi:predicted TIM-barrel fold metal-dependent hydrolase